MDPGPSHDHIELRAYHLWEERGRPWGTPEIDWVAAERELTAGDPESPLSKIAREVGAVVGSVVAFLSEA